MVKQRVSGLVNNPSATRKKKDLARGINPDNPNPTPIRAQDPGNTGRVNPAPSVGQGKTEVRPTGAPVSANVDVTNKTQSQQDAIRQKAQIAQTAPLANQVGTATQPTNQDSSVVVQPIQQAPGQMAPVDNPTQTLPQQLQGFDLNQAVGAGLVSGGVAAAGGAAAGLATAGTLSVPLAVAGGIGGFIVGVRNNLKSQTAGKIAAQSQDLTTRQRNLRALITDTNHNPQNAAENLQMFNQQLGLIDKAQMELEMETNNDLNKFLGEDGTPELQKFDTFNSGSRELLIRQMQLAIINPNPSVNLIGLDDISQ